MSTIFYMLRKEWKNRLLALFRHPGKLVVYILLVVLLVNSVISTALTPQADLGGFWICASCTALTWGFCCCSPCPSS